MFKSNHPVTMRGRFYRDKKLPKPRADQTGCLDRIICAGRFYLNGKEYTSMLNIDKYKNYEKTPENARIMLVEEVGGLNYELSKWAQNNIDFAEGPLGQYLGELQVKLKSVGLALIMQGDQSILSIKTIGENQISFSVKIFYELSEGEKMTENIKMYSKGSEDNYPLVYEGEIQANLDKKGEVVATLVKDEVKYWHKELKGIFLGLKKTYIKDKKPDTSDLDDEMARLREEFAKHLDADAKSYFDYELRRIKNKLDLAYDPDLNDFSCKFADLEKKLKEKVQLENLIGKFDEELEGVNNQRHTKELRAFLHGVIEELNKYKVYSKRGSCFLGLKDAVVEKIKITLDSEPLKKENDEFKEILIKYNSLFSTLFDHLALQQEIKQFRVMYNEFRKQIGDQSSHVTLWQDLRHIRTPHKEGTKATKRLAKIVKEIEKEMESGKVDIDHIKLKDKFLAELKEAVSVNGELKNPHFPAGKALKCVFEKSIKRVEKSFPVSSVGSTHRTVSTN